MKRTIRVSSVLLMLLSYSSAWAEDTAQALHALFDKAWERELRDNPLEASSRGDKRYNARWPDWSSAALDAEHREDLETLAELRKIPATSLSADEQLNRELFRRLYERRLALYDFNARFRPLDQLNYSNSIQTLGSVPEVLSFDTEKDYLDWIERLRAFGMAVDQVIALARTGIKMRNVQPRVIVERTLAQVRSQLGSPEASAFYSPFKGFPASIPASQQQALRDSGRDAVRNVVLPAFKRLEQFLANEYLPASRTTVGIWDTPNGDAYYRHCVQWFTTTDLTPEQIHDTGRAEVARIRAEMDRVMATTGFKGSFAEFLHFLRTDARFRYTDPQMLLQKYMVMAKRIDPLLMQYFGHLPRMSYGVRPIPASLAPDTTTAYYQPGSLDAHRAGFYYVNLYKPEERPTYEIPVLTTHEAVPGHHIQQAIAEEAGGLPEFRHDFEATAFVEGWALYAESLGDEMGLYADPYDKFGQLTYEMWRAVRLVVDTGMHAKHWTREQAIQYFKDNTAKSELDIVNEVDRYIAWPGQATAYKIGELKIKELRRHATERLGDRFDIRAFHDELLKRGALPLDILEKRMDEWMAKQTGH